MTRSKRGSKTQGTVKKPSSTSKLEILIKDALSEVDRYIKKIQKSGKNHYLVTSADQKIPIAGSNLKLKDIENSVRSVLVLRQLLTLIRKDKYSYIEHLEVVGDDKRFTIDISPEESQSSSFYALISKLERDNLLSNLNIELVELIDLILNSKLPVDLAIRLKRIINARNERTFSLREIENAEKLSWVKLDGFDRIMLSNFPRIRAIIYELHSLDAYSADKAIPTKNLASIKYEVGEYIKREKKKLSNDKVRRELILRKIFLRDFTRTRIFLDPLITIG